MTIHQHRWIGQHWDDGQAVHQCNQGHEGRGASSAEAYRDLLRACDTADALSAGTETYAWPMPAWHGDTE